ncbi:ABC transporter G family member 39 isoform X2 [Vitis vinifera]|uniref:ABC transporter G family member 39 isoform X2 n=1 Tax=Vitis vinifera TaxID=29760 RepID=UPI0008FEBD1B|nr:ABC transporter G family member 39 isoform X2 [Vitis vinifera]|eukprot:XP_019078624.1 PREDICTED: ABC transporter G family member 39 isoform X2 [Vitis vinifera]
MELGQLRTIDNVEENGDEEALKWAALERLPTYDRARKGIFNGDAGESKGVDLRKLGFQEREELLNRVIRHADDNEEFLRKLKNRMDRVSLDLPTIEVRFENLNVEAEAYVGSRALPTILNSYFNQIEGLLNFLHILPSKKRKISVLHNTSGIIKPGRMTLLLGPPSSGKTTLLLALSGKLDSELKFSGKVTYNGYEMHEFVPQRTSAYISQEDVHISELTVRETLTFAARCQGVGTNYDALMELLRREKEANVKPDSDIDMYMKILGLEVCADTIVGDVMRRGISGGQKKRVTIGEMLVGPSMAFFMDNISTGLDSSTTFQIINSIKQSIHILNKTTLISLLQPAPETYDLFDDIILISEGQIVYQGPCEYVLEFFESMGFRCPERKGIADYLQEVTSRKDQKQYWANEAKPYSYVSINEFTEAFKAFHVGRAIQCELATPFNRARSHPAALTKSKYGTSKKELLKACLSREFILMKRNSSLYAFKLLQFVFTAIIVATIFTRSNMHHKELKDGTIYLGALYFGLTVTLFSGFFELSMTIGKLPVFYKQRDLLFYPSWAYSLPTPMLGTILSILEVTLWIAITYYAIGFDPDLKRMSKQYLILAMNGQMSYGFFRCIAALSRNFVIANTSAHVALIWLLIFSGFVLARENITKWLSWGYWTSPLMYVQNALSVNEFLGEKWKVSTGSTAPSLGISVLKSRCLFTNPDWYWIGFGALICFIFLFHGIYNLALAYLNEYGKSRAVFLSEEALKEKHINRTGEENRTSEYGAHSNGNKASRKAGDVGKYQEKGMLLPFRPLTIAFENIRYSVDMPQAMKAQGVEVNRLVLLKGLNGTFRPGVLTALMGVSGAGKTTLLDMLSGRKNIGYIEGNITVSGYPKKQETFARVSGYCEQNDIHSPLVTVYESLLYSAWLRLPAEINPETREIFIQEVMELIELTPLGEALVGYPNVNGLSVEQRKRLTIAVELVANPSIIFMDEPTSGLDARAASIVMRAVRKIVDTGRTVVCTIHQPSIDIFESFDELFLLKRGGEEIYVGPLGHQAGHMIKYFEEINGVDRIKDGYNPATWVLEVTTDAQEEFLGVKFAEIYKKSDLFQRNKALIKELSTPPPNSQDLNFSSQYPRSFLTQFKACLWRYYKSYWRNTAYNSLRFLASTMEAFMLGITFWGLGSNRRTGLDIFNVLGSLHTAVMFLGTQNASIARPVVIMDRAVFYRERAAGFYSALPCAIAQIAIEIPYTLTQAIIYGIIVYTMMGLELKAAKFLLYLLFQILSLLYFTYYGMMIIAVSPNQEIATLLSALFYTLWNIFSGFIIPRKRIPVWWRWYAWVCPVAWSLYGFAASQYGDVQTKMESSETVAEYMRNYFGYRHDFLGVVCMVLIGFNVLFASVFAYSMKALNFQKR